MATILDDAMLAAALRQLVARLIVQADDSEILRDAKARHDYQEIATAAIAADDLADFLTLGPPEYCPSC